MYINSITDVTSRCLLKLSLSFCNSLLSHHLGLYPQLCMDCVSESCINTMIFPVLPGSTYVYPQVAESELLGSALKKRLKSEQCDGATLRLGSPLVSFDIRSLNSFNLLTFYWPFLRCKQRKDTKSLKKCMLQTVKYQWISKMRVKLRRRHALKLQQFFNHSRQQVRS